MCRIKMRVKNHDIEREKEKSRAYVYTRENCTMNVSAKSVRRTRDSRTPFNSDLTRPFIGDRSFLSLQRLAQERSRVTRGIAFLTSASDTVLSAKLRTLQWRKAVPPSCTVTLDTVLLSFASFTLCSSSRLLNQRARQSDGMLYGTRRSAERKITGGCNYIDLIKSIVCEDGRGRKNLDTAITREVIIVDSADCRRTFLSE